MAGLWNKGQVMETKLKAMSHNVQGIRNNQKRSVLLKMFRKEKYDIVCLQETHLLSDETKLIESHWKGPKHVSGGTTRSKGLCTLFAVKHNADNIKLVYTDERIIISSLVVDKETIFIVNVYAPCIEKEKSQFLVHLRDVIKSYIDKGDNENIVCLGDFNLVADNTLDIILSGDKHNKTKVQDFNNFIEGNDFTDTWRTLHPGIKDYTWRRGSPPIARRLDYIFLSQPLATFLEHAGISTVGFSDHRRVSITMGFHNFKRGKGLYKLNTSLLKDIKYVQLIKKVIEESSKNNSSLNPHCKWEMVKTRIREASQKYSRFKSSGNRCAVKELVREVDKLETELCQNPEEKKNVP